MLVLNVNHASHERDTLAKDGVSEWRDLQDLTLYFQSVQKLPQVRAKPDLSSDPARAGSSLVFSAESACWYRISGRVVHNKLDGYRAAMWNHVPRVQAVL